MQRQRRVARADRLVRHERSGVHAEDQRQQDLAQDGYDILNLRLGYDDIALGDGRLSISGWVRNATDEEYKIGGYEFDLTGIGLGRASTSQWGEPRTYGVDVSYRFGSM
ncbi:MAG: TonB-dependent receptor [Gammaproteobacteria bacterium]|nr:TonB-dependent receptor [Gammaproteobacteria bacterium]